MGDIEEIELIEAIARGSADQPLLKTCPLCGKGMLSLVVNLANPRRQGRILGQREYHCEFCKADVAVHFAPILPREKSGDLPVFCRRPEDSPKVEVKDTDELRPIEIRVGQCQSNRRCILPDGHKPTTEASGCSLRNYMRRWGTKTLQQEECDD